MTAAKPKRAPTINDVASLAGVSSATVSRYLNHSSHISEATSERIAKAIELLDYRPSGIARGLAKAVTDTIAVLSTNTTLLGSAVTIQGIEDRAYALGYAVTISKLDEDSHSGKESVHAALDQNPRGVIVLKYDDAAINAIRYIPDDVPCVLIGGDYDPYHTHISLEEYQGGLRVTDYLLDTGAETVWHVAVPGAGGGRNRTAGWREALRRRGIQEPPVQTAGWSPDKAREIGREFAERGVKAVFAGNDEIAMGVMSGLMDAGLRVPEDVRVAGFDDHPLSTVWRPPVTTYRQNFNKAGLMSVDLLVAQVDAAAHGGDTGARALAMEGELVIRRSA